MFSKYSFIQRIGKEENEKEITPKLQIELDGKKVEEIKLKNNGSYNILVKY